MTPPSAFPAARRRVRIAALIIALEGLGYLAFVALELGDVTGARLAIGLGSVVLLIGYAAFHGWAAWRLLSLAEHSRGAAVVIQLLQIGLAWSLRDLEPVVIPAALVGAAFAVLVIVLHPSVTRAITEGEAQAD